MKVRDLVIQVRLSADKAFSGLKSLDRGARTAAEGFKQTRDASGRLRDELGRFVKGGDQATGVFGKMSAAAGKFGISSASVVSALRSIGGAFVGAANKAIEFESAMADVSKVIPGMAKGTETFNEMKESIFDLSKEIAIAPEGFAKIIAAAGQAGIAKEELRDFAEDAAKMSVAFDSTAEKSGAAMAKMRTGLGLNQKEVFQLAGQFNYLGQNMAVTGSELVDVTSRVGLLGGGVEGDGHLRVIPGVDMASATMALSAAMAWWLPRFGREIDSEKLWGRMENGDLETPGLMYNLLYASSLNLTLDTGGMDKEALNGMRDVGFVAWASMLDEYLVSADELNLLGAFAALHLFRPF